MMVCSYLSHSTLLKWAIFYGRHIHSQTCYALGSGMPIGNNKVGMVVEQWQWPNETRLNSTTSSLFLII